MSGSIGFATIPGDIRVPLFYAEFDNSRAGPAVYPQRTLLIGQTITALAATLRLVSSADQVAGLTGAGSMLHRMMGKYRQNDGLGEVWILPLADDAGAVAATGTFTFSGTATAAGTAAIYVNATLVAVAVTVGMTAAQLATAAAAAINANTFLPVTAAAVSAVLTVTAKNKGAAGNSIDLRVNLLGTAGGEALPAGITVVVAGMASGATDPALTGVADILGDQEFDFIVAPYNLSGALNALRDMMADRWSYLKQVYGHAFSAARDSAGDLVTLGSARNDPHVTIWGREETNPIADPEWAAAHTGAIAQALKADPARPVQTVAVLGVMATPIGGRFKITDRQSLLSNGIATSTNGDDGSVAIQRAVTTYQKNSFNQPDQSYLDTETLFTLMAIVRRLRTAMTQKFARSKLADDGTRFGPGQPVATPRIVKAEIVAQYAEMEADGLVENADAFIAATLVIRNPNDKSRLDILWAPDLINGLRIMAVLAQFRL